jgi:hypothetical protein
MKPGRKAERQTEPTIRAEWTIAARSALLVAAGAALVIVAVADAAAAGDSNYAHNRWYVSATAAAGGDGSANAPFNSLALVQQASGSGDTIIIEPSPSSVPPLDGGIVLKAGQRLIGGGPPVVKFGAPLISDGPPVVGASSLSSLPRITNTTSAANSGDAVRLADNTDVENLVIVGPYRGAIYGLDAMGVTVHGNDISGFNTSGTVGFVVQPLDIATFTPGVGLEIATGIPAGWAAILIDTANVSTTLSIENNYLHDGVCGDGIDIRGMNTGDVGVQVNFNFITRLVQCHSVSAIQGISTQVTGSSRLRATLFGNTQANNGSPGANMDRLFVNPAESGTLVETIDHNVDITGIGGASTNGFEYIVSNGGGTSHVTISNSYFRNNPGDMLEELNDGVGSTATLALDNVTVEDTTISGGLPPYANPPVGSPPITANLGECLAISADGANDTTVLQMTDSSFSGCDNDGIQVTGNHATGNGVGNLHTIWAVLGSA